MKRPANCVSEIGTVDFYLAWLDYWMTILHAAETQSAFESIVHGSLLPAAFAKPSAEQYHETH
jgi:hypothetical protein